MALAACWLGRRCPVEPHYQTANSKSQSLFHTRILLALPSARIEQERSIRSLPPVDLLLPDHNIVVEIQGPYHYVGGDFQTRNGSTLLKTALLKKSGYDVIEIPVTQLQTPDSVQACIDHIQQKVAGLSVDEAFVPHSSSDPVAMGGESSSP